MAEGPGADQVPSQAGDQPAGPSSERPHRHGAAPGKGNTPARTPLTPYKRWYNSNRPGKRERAAGETSRGIPLPENLRLEKGDLKGKGKPKGKDKGKGKGPESKGKEAGKEQGGKGLGKTPPPPPPAKKRPLVTEPGPSAKARQEPDAEYSYYSESDAEPKASASEARPSAKFLQLIKEGAQARQKGREEPAAAAAAAAKPEPSSSESSSESERINQPKLEPCTPGVNQEKEDRASTEEARQAMAEMEIEPTEPADSPRDVAMVEVNLPGPGEETAEAGKPGDPRSNQETRQPANPNAAFSTEPGVNQGSQKETMVEPPGDEPGSDFKSPEGPVEEPEEVSQAKEEDREEQASSTDSVYEPIVLREAPVTPGSTGHPMPNYSETMEFRVEVKKASVKPCHSRYHPVLSVRYQNADQTGVTSVQLQVLGLGGSRIVCAAPHATDRVWKISEYPQDIEQRVSRLFGPITMDGVKAAGVHRLVELGLKDQAKDPAWVTVLEAEKVDPLPPLSDLVAIQAVFSIALVSKVLSPRDLGQYNLGSRPGAPGCIRELVFVDCNGWEEYEEHQHAAFPNMRKALGFWKTIAHYDEGLKQNLCSIVQTYHNDLEALTVNLRDFARRRLSQECYSNLMHCLVQSQVLGISPEGLLCQFVPVGGRPHNLVPGKSWTLVPFPAPSVGTSGPSRA